jgi:hypothetical protein
LEEFWPCPVFAIYTLAFALQLRKKHGETSGTAHCVISAAFFSRSFNVFKFQICAEHWKCINELQENSVDCHWLRRLDETATDLNQNWWSSSRDSTYGVGTFGAVN